jgi:hypothetical protein
LTCTDQGTGNFACNADNLENGINRPGSDYNGYPIAVPNPMICHDDCFNDPNCKAFTYVNPGIQSTYAVCWLKNAVPAPVPDGNCVSGVR